MTPDEIDALVDYTPAQHVKRIDYLVATGQAGVSYSIRGKQFTHPSLPDLINMREYYAGLSAEATGDADETPMGRVSYAQFTEPR